MSTHIEMCDSVSSVFCVTQFKEQSLKKGKEYEVGWGKEPVILRVINVWLCLIVTHYVMCGMIPIYRGTN